MSSFAMGYVLGAADAPPPAGAAPAAGAPGAPETPAALSRAALTAWPLNVLVGANSPSLCPIICSVTYTGINFLPLCTAIVWPIMSGRIVDRRDHVLITFFSLRAFIPATLIRRWSSMNGPFLSERPIVSPYASTLILSRLFLFPPAALDPLRASQFPESAHGAGHAVRYRTERAHKPGALRVRCLLHGDSPSGLAQPVQHLHRNRWRKPADGLRRLCCRTCRPRGFARSRHPPCRWSCSPAS